MQKKTQRGRTVQPVERRVTSRERQVLDHLLELPVRVAPLRECLLEPSMHLQGRLAPREIMRCDWYRPTCAKAPLNPSASSAKIHNRTGKFKGPIQEYTNFDFRMIHGKNMHVAKSTK